MFEARKIFNERKEEIDGFFDHLSSFEKQNSNQKLEQTLKASCFLLLQELREITHSKEIPDRISNDSPFLLIDRDI